MIVVARITLRMSERQKSEPEIGEEQLESVAVWQALRYEVGAFSKLNWVARTQAPEAAKLTAYLAPPVPWNARGLSLHSMSDTSNCFCSAATMQ